MDGRAGHRRSQEADGGGGGRTEADAWTASAAGADGTAGRGGGTGGGAGGRARSGGGGRGSSAGDRPLAPTHGAGGAGLAVHGEQVRLRRQRKRVRHPPALRPVLPGAREAGALPPRLRQPDGGEAGGAGGEEAGEREPPLQDEPALPGHHRLPGRHADPGAAPVLRHAGRPLHRLQDPHQPRHHAVQVRTQGGVPGLLRQGARAAAQRHQGPLPQVRAPHGEARVRRVAALSGGRPALLSRRQSGGAGGEEGPRAKRSEQPQTEECVPPDDPGGH